ncbi:MAG: DUF3037 domain-containing protein [Solirubrobacteraceae bacterium]
MAFQFSLIRFVPDPARGEFVNIGAIAGSDEAREWELRLVSNLSRAKALDDRGVLSKAFAYAAGLEDHIAALDLLPETAGPEPISAELLRRRAMEMHNIVQFSPPAPVAADSADAALELVFDQLVLAAARKSFAFEKKHRAQGAARRAYQAHHVPAGAVRERAPVRSGVFDGTFDFAVHNGRTVQLVQCWSFQLPNQADLAEQVKAWSWLVHEVRQAGGQLATTDGDLEVPAALDIFAIAIPPVDGAESPAYEEARAAFAENDVTELSPDEADRVGEQAAAALGAAA